MIVLTFHSSSLSSTLGLGNIGSGCPGKEGMYGFNWSILKTGQTCILAGKLSL